LPAGLRPRANIERAPTATASVGHDARAGHSVAAAALYLAFVIYGSLVPLDFQPVPLAEAWRRYLDTTYLTLGVEARADWVANILLYIPLAYLLCAASAGPARAPVTRLLRTAIVFVACASVALVVEFTQLFFPPRTVSLNDIVAEFLGSAVGIGLWLVWGASLRRLRGELAHGGRTAIRAAIGIYVIGYLAFSLFPYDFLVSSSELSAKLANDTYALWMVRPTCSRFAFCSAKLAIEALAALPLGMLLGMALGRTFARPYRAGAIAGAVLGLLIEGGQLLLASGVSEGASIVTRAAGVTAGVWLSRHVERSWLSRLRAHAISILLCAAPVYVVALAWANRWFTARWTGLDAALANLRDVRWLPFYYHYYTTETHALQSLLAVLAMYLPVGVGYSIATARDAAARRSNAVVPAVIAAVLAIVMEGIKLLVPGQHPDPTNVIIAFASAFAGCIVVMNLQEWTLQSRSAERPRSHAAGGARVETPGGMPIIAAGMLLVFAVAMTIVYPLRPVYVALPLVGWAIALWRVPSIGLPGVLALVPLLDFSPHTGWVIVSESDVFLAVTLAVALLRTPAADAGARLDRAARFAVALVIVSFCISALVGLFPLSPLDGNALYSYLGSYNALRILKGPLWALLLLPLLTRERDRASRIALGIVAGLACVVAVAIRQRLAFAGLFDATSDYRIEGTFPEMHVGGGDIHAYLVLATPFIFAWVALRPARARMGASAALLVLASYALAVTFARGGYAGYFTALAIVAGVSVLRLVRAGESRAAGGLLIAAFAGVAVVVSIMSGAFMHARVAASAGEAGTRLGHWTRALRLMDDGLEAALVGMGLGTFPRTVVFKDRPAASATVSYERREGLTLARLGSGRPLFLGQYVDVAPHAQYTLSLATRSDDPGAMLGASLCEKSVQYSFRCSDFVFPVTGAGWQRRSITFDSAEIGSGPPFLRRPVVLSFANMRSGSTLDLRDVRLLDVSGADLVMNGDFARGGSQWTFAADDHLPWHIFNLWIDVYFEQGLLGVATLALVLALALWRCGVYAVRGDWFATALLGSLCGFVVVGMSESPFDGPRVTTIFFMLVLAALLLPSRDTAADKNVTFVA
jgi:VanZ family protein